MNGQCPYVGLVLTNNKSIVACIKVEYGFVIRGFPYRGPITYQFSADDCCYGYSDFIERKTALSLLEDGVLTVEVQMKPAGYSAPFIPTNPSACPTVRDLYMDEESADIVFEVKGGANNDAGSQEEILTVSTKFYAHRLILKKAAPVLFELCKSNSDDSFPIEIPNLSPDTFKSVLLYIYGHDIPKLGRDQAHTKNIILAADKYGVVNLKLEAEARYVTSLTLSLDNVMENLLFADSKNCALLEEKVVDFIIKNKIKILKNKLLLNAPSSLSTDILAAIARSDEVLGGSDEFCAMSVSELRYEARAKGLDIDGSRDTLISTIVSYYGN